MLMLLDWHVFACKMAHGRNASQGSEACVLSYADVANKPNDPDNYNYKYDYYNYRVVWS